VTGADPAATVRIVLGRAGRLAALGAVALLALLLAATEPRAVDGPLGAAAAVDQFVAEASAVAATPAPRVKPTGQPIGKRTTALIARLATGSGTAVLAVALLGAVPAARRARRSRWRRAGIRGPPALLLA
jgi:hypothetical protein